LSEPIFAAPNAADDPLLVKNPFSYCFEYSKHSKCLTPGTSVERSNQKWSSLDWKWELPQEKSKEDTSHAVYYKPNSKKTNYLKEYYDGATKGDSIVDLTYLAYRTSSGPDAPTTRMPKATDWIKIRPPSSEEGKGGVNVFFDAEGNTANPREIGVLISGTNYYKKLQVKIAVIDKDATPEDPVLNGIFDDGRKPTWISEESKKYANDHLFQPGDVAEFLPIPKEYSDNIDTIKANYPGSLGTVFKIADAINPEVDKILRACDNKCTTINNQPLTAGNIAGGITLHASVYYHTNIGDYTAHRVPAISNCTDKIFMKENPKHEQFGNNCLGNEYDFYLAWDLRTNKNRFVGTGAYVAITKFYWQIEYLDANGDLKTPKFNQDEFVEMFGVRRGK